MPEFKNRVDNYRWQTPAFSEVFSLEELSKIDESTLSDIKNKLKVMFTDLGMTANLSSERVMPSYTCYDVVLNRPAADMEAFQNSIYELEADNGWIVALQPETKTKFQVFIRTDKHYSLNWKHIVTRITFRKANAPTNFIAGVNFQQKTLVLDWNSLEHLLIIGTGGSKQSIIRNILITAMMLNTPGEFRFALIGHGSDAYRLVKDAPHALGNFPRIHPEHGSQLLLGMRRELKRRQAIFERMDVQDFDTCNILLEDEDEAQFPRLMLILDTLNHVDWIKKHEEWLPRLTDLLESGAQYGIHLLVTSHGIHLPYPFDEIGERMPNRIISRSAAVDTTFMGDIKNFHPSLTRFVDSFLQYGETIHPIELPAITSADIRALVTYWKNNKEIRYNSLNMLNIGGSVEDTMRALVQDFMNEKSELSPPIPGKPSAETLARAAEVLAEEEKKTDVYSLGESMSSNGHDLENSGNISVETVNRAQALATYLGWLGKGPLMDVLGLSLEEANTVIAILQARQILERGTSPTPHLHFKRRRQGQ